MSMVINVCCASLICHANLKNFAVQYAVCNNTQRYFMQSAAVVIVAAVTSFHNDPALGGA